MQCYRTFELNFRGEPPKIGQEVAVDLEAIFTLAGTTTRVKGFHAGDGRYVIRFLPLHAGHCTWRVRGLFEGDGSEECLPAQSEDLSLHDSERKESAALWHVDLSSLHGMVRANGARFAYDDGTPYRPFGTTVYALVHQSQELIDQTIETLTEAPFNKVRMCVFPKHYFANAADPQWFPFERTGGRFDSSRPCYRYWDELERRIGQMRRIGIEVDLILFHPYDRWGFARMSHEECLTYLDYAVRRLAALPNVWWSLANEYDLMTDFEDSWWRDFAAFIGGNDPYHHLLSNHNFVNYWDFDEPNTTHCCVQNGHTGLVRDLIERHGKPVIFDEVGYEGNIIYDWGNLSAFELVDRFWTAFTLGGYCTHGETFEDPDDVLWWARGGELHGESPVRIAFLREVMESLPNDMEPAVGGAFGMPVNELLAMRKSGELPDGVKGTMTEVIMRLDEKRFLDLVQDLRPIQGRSDDDVMVWYLSRQCCVHTEIELPDTRSYDVEVIDAWDMTRTTVLEGVTGKVIVPMLGKEGQAIIATAR
ncbi:hypothetical protein Uis1B_0918 [Bifidobacterium margollesii]|uniref:Alpha-L-rhamnosidase n=1 Tax=Bifidobacterium margollesii TaxID=2020964 RepID=A0A2N5JAC4_9BIFI|nr:DUF4038 domain-containing protein [Bifidobacterium margollesii]PLS31174.1 hypothetical protein Uis1B_0918 [Bifidobacterium margollesii]